MPRALRSPSAPAEPGHARGVRALPACPRPRAGQPADPTVRRGGRAMRRRPDRAVERDGVQVAYEVFGHDGPGLLLIPAAPIGRGRGRARPLPCPATTPSSPSTRARRPVRTGPPAGAAYGPGEMVRGPARGPRRRRPDPGGGRRPLPCRAVGPAIGRRKCRPRVRCRRHRSRHRARSARRALGGADRALGRRGRRSKRMGAQPPLLAAGHPAWPRFFFDQLLPGPHSTKQYEDAVSWALETDPETMIAEGARS